MCLELFWKVRFFWKQTLTLSVLFWGNVLCYLNSHERHICDPSFPFYDVAQNYVNPVFTYILIICFQFIEFTYLLPWYYILKETFYHYRKSENSKFCTNNICQEWCFINIFSVLHSGPARNDFCFIDMETEAQESWIYLSGFT